MKITRDSTNIKISGHTGTFYVIDTFYENGITLYLLESEQWGDEAFHIIVNSLGNVVLDEVSNGFLDYKESI